MKEKLVTTEQRRLLMSRVRQSGTALELLLRKELWKIGFRYRLRIKEKLPGTPDIIFAKSRVAIFVDGCFWHGCPIHGTMSKTNSEFWSQKIKRNKQRDIEVDKKLFNRGWHSIRFWEHDLKKNINLCVEKIINEVENRP